MADIRVAIAGVGSCASSLVQFVANTRAGKHAVLPGVAHPRLAGFEVGNIVFVAAFDVDHRKIGLDLSTAVFGGTNSAKKYFDVPPQRVQIQTGPLADGIDGELAKVITPHQDSLNFEPSRLIDSLRQSKADLLVCYLPTGASKAVRIYAEAAAYAGVGFINTTPERIARDPYFQQLFIEKNDQLMGDDTKSLLGATTLHTALIGLFKGKGIEITGTYQINVGGNTDFLNLSDAARSASKVASKRTALSGAGIDASRVLAGPNGYVEYLGDTKICYLKLEGRSVLGSSLSIEARLQVEDSPNSAGVVVDAIRVAMAARIRGLRGVIAEPCAMLFKSPPVPVDHAESARLFETFVAGLGNQR